VTIHHLAYLIDLSDAGFFPIPSIDSYFVDWVTSGEYCLSHEFEWHKVLL